MSNRIDQELAEVIGTEGDPHPVQPSPRNAVRSGKARRSVGLLVILAVASIAFAAIVFKSLGSSVVYAKSVDQLLASRDRILGRQVRVEGTLVHGSLLRKDNPCEYRFQLTNNGSVLEVHYAQCVLPDRFRDRPETDVAVTALGELTPEGFFSASDILTKCPSKYEERDGRRVPVGNWDQGSK